MKNLYCSKHATGLLVALAFCLTNIPCCASQRNFLSLGTKIEDKKPTSALSRTRKQKKPFFVGAAAAEIIVDDDGEAYRRVIAILSFVVWWYKASYCSVIFTLFPPSQTEELVIEEDEPSAILESCEVGFDGIKMTLKQKGDKPDRLILDGSLKGKAKPGRMLAVMGPSGSGMSIFFSIS